MQIGSPVRLKLLAVCPGNGELEHELHTRFAASRVHGEWFDLTPELDALIRDTRAQYGACDAVTGPPEVRDRRRPVILA